MWTNLRAHNNCLKWLFEPPIDSPWWDAGFSISCPTCMWVCMYAYEHGYQSLQYQTLQEKPVDPITSPDLEYEGGVRDYCGHFRYDNREPDVYDVESKFTESQKTESFVQNPPKKVQGVTVGPTINNELSKSSRRRLASLSSSLSPLIRVSSHLGAHVNENLNLERKRRRPTVSVFLGFLVVSHWFALLGGRARMMQGSGREAVCFESGIFSF